MRARAATEGRTLPDERVHAPIDSLGEAWEVEPQIFSLGSFAAIRDVDQSPAARASSHTVSLGEAWEVEPQTLSLG